MKISLKPIVGDTIQVECDDENETIGSLKKRVYVQNGIKAKYQRIIYLGNELSDDATLGSSNIKTDTTIHLVMTDEYLKQKNNNQTEESINLDNTDYDPPNQLKKKLDDLQARYNEISETMYESNGFFGRVKSEFRYADSDKKLIRGLKKELVDIINEHKEDSNDMKIIKGYCEQDTDGNCDLSFIDTQLSDYSILRQGNTKTRQLVDQLLPKLNPGGCKLFN